MSIPHLKNLPCPAAVRAKVIGIDTEAQKLSLGLKPSYFEGEEEEENPEDDADMAAEDVDEEAFEAAAGLDSNEDDIEPGGSSRCYAIPVCCDQAGSGCEKSLFVSVSMCPACFAEKLDLRPASPLSASQS